MVGVEGADELRTQALLEQQHDVPAPRGGERPNGAGGGTRGEGDRGRSRLGEQRLEPPVVRAGVAGGVETVVGGVEAEQGFAESVGAVRGQLADEAVGRMLDQRPRRERDGEQGQQAGMGEQHRDPGQERRRDLRGAPEPVPQRKEQARHDRRQRDEDLSRRVALPDIGHDFGRVEQVVDGNEVEPAVELLEEEPLGRSDEERPEEDAGQAGSERHPLPPRLPPAFGEEGEIEHQGQDAPGCDPEIEQGAGGEDADQDGDRMRDLAAPGEDERHPGQRAQHDQDEPESEGQPEAGEHSGQDGSGQRSEAEVAGEGINSDYGRGQ